jgi:protein-disulfide isomerase
LVAREVIPTLIEQYVDTGKVRYVYREFPLTSIHPAAQKAAEAAVCAGQQGSYWEMNEKLFATQDEWGQGADPTSFFKEYAKELGLDADTFDQCLDSGEAALAVQADTLAGNTFGVSATPYFFISGANSGDLPVRGGLPIESLGQVIDYVAAGGSTPEIVPMGEDWHVLGDMQTARAVTVAFVDYSSPVSAQHAREVLPELLKQYVDSGKMLYVLHPWSSAKDSPGAQAAIAAECAGEQGKYWEMHDLLFAEQESWTQGEGGQAASDRRDLFISYAESLGLDSAKFEQCLDSESAALRVQAGDVVAALYGVGAAPVFLFNDGQGPRLPSTFDEFKAIIDAIVNQ